jgi:3-hydroxyisobutyrate dehydrogenase-like beta-hydroxyacid dehydrogenase
MTDQTAHGAPLRVCLIGYGEVGKIFSAGFAALPGVSVAAFDVLFGQAAAATGPAGVTLCRTLAQAVAGADVVISAVTASSAAGVAERAAAELKAGQYFVDINSVSPETKKRGYALLSAAGIRYVEAAVMASVPPYGLKVPILLGGPNGQGLAALLARAGMNLACLEAELGTASAIKMCRSIMIKGIEALTVEAMLAARHYGVEEQVLASLDETFPSMNWQVQADYLVSRVVQHGRRRAAEVREAAHTVHDAQLQPLMATAIAQRQDWLADQVDAGIVERSEKSWRKVADALGAAANSEGKRSQPTSPD